MRRLHTAFENVAIRNGSRRELGIHLVRTTIEQEKCVEMGFFSCEGIFSILLPVRGAVVAMWLEGNGGGAWQQVKLCTESVLVDII